MRMSMICSAASLCLPAGLLAASLLAGCGSSDQRPTTRPATAYERQQKALEDPFGYSPDMDRAHEDVSGGDLGHFDREAMKKDLDHVFNP